MSGALDGRSTAGTLVCDVCEAWVVIFILLSID